MSPMIPIDRNCDLPAEAICRYGISVGPLYINFGSKSYIDGVELSRQEFYRNTPGYEHHPTTSVPGQGKFQETCDRLACQRSLEILSLHTSFSLSAVLNSGHRSPGHQLPAHLETRALHAPVPSDSAPRRPTPAPTMPGAFSQCTGPTSD